MGMVIDFGKPISLFPLNQCVLLPHATIPLHIFEPRYRAMVRDALDSRGLIAMACLAGQHARGEFDIHPPIKPAVCVGYIVRHDRLPDGRYNILLQGLTRARIEEEKPHSPYRIAQLEPIESEAPDEALLQDRRAEIEELLNDAQLRKLIAVSAIHNWLSREILSAALIDLTAMTICDDNEMRYRLLDEPNVVRRAEMMIAQLRGIRHTLDLAFKFGEPQTEDGCTLN